MEAISVFDIFKIGVGPSSSHTLGPWRAAQLFLQELESHDVLALVEKVTVELYGSLAKTGQGHGTDIAVQLGLMDEDPKTFPTESLGQVIGGIRRSGRLNLAGRKEIAFVPMADIRFHFNQTLDFHPNGVTFRAVLEDGRSVFETYFSVGGGFVVTEHEVPGKKRTVTLPWPTERGRDISEVSAKTGMSIPEYVLENEGAWRSKEEIERGLDELWETMFDCLYRGCSTEGILPGGLEVSRRAKEQMDDLLEGATYETPEEWLELVKGDKPNFEDTLRWISTFALAVNEENAAFGRVVTAPTNGAAGVIPAVMMYGTAFLGFDTVKRREFC